MMAKFNLLRRPKTNYQILQQSVLMKYKSFASFLKDHGPEVFPEVRAIDSPPDSTPRKLPPVQGPPFMEDPPPNI
jgi:hypothetical protein